MLERIITFLLCQDLVLALGLSPKLGRVKPRDSHLHMIPQLYYVFGLEFSPSSSALVREPPPPFHHPPQVDTSPALTR